MPARERKRPVSRDPYLAVQQTKFGSELWAQMHRQEGTKHHPPRHQAAEFTHTIAGKNHISIHPFFSPLIIPCSFSCGKADHDGGCAGRNRLPSSRLTWPGGRTRKVRMDGGFIKGRPALRGCRLKSAESAGPSSGKAFLPFLAGSRSRLWAIPANGPETKPDGRPQGRILN